ncbi:MAG: hypothetical protein OXL98_10175 [Acidimicrobiaceae bacterium]|nr:hypothetical protein [Acidimicrobiaceae bacterium]
MQTRVWVNPRQPQTLYIAQLLMYFQGGFSLVFAMLGARSLGIYTLTIAVGKVMAAFGIANERRWGYRLGVVVAVMPLALLLLLAVADTPRWLWADAIGLLFDIALVALLLHPMSRDYQRHWPKRQPG